MSDICIFQIKMELQAKNDGQMMTQGVVLQYRDKYIKINTEATDENTRADLIYDTEEVKFNIFSQIML